MRHSACRSPTALQTPCNSGFRRHRRARMLERYSKEKGIRVHYFLRGVPGTHPLPWFGHGRAAYRVRCYRGSTDALYSNALDHRRYRSGTDALLWRRKALWAVMQLKTAACAARAQGGGRPKKQNSADPKSPQIPQKSPPEIRILLQGSRALPARLRGAPGRQRCVPAGGAEHSAPGPRQGREGPGPADLYEDRKKIGGIASSS